MWAVDNFVIILVAISYQLALQMFAVLHLTNVVAWFFPGGVDIPAKDRPAAMQFGAEVLMQSRAGFAVAGPLQQMLRKTAHECCMAKKQGRAEAISWEVATEGDDGWQA